MLHSAKRLRVGTPYLPVRGCVGVLLAKAIAGAQQIDNVICRYQDRISLWASRCLTSADQRRRRIEQVQLALKALDELRRSEYSGDALQAFEDSFKRLPGYLREKEVLDHLRTLDRLEVQALYLAAL